VSRLKVVDLAKNFGGIQAVNHINLEVTAGQRHAIIGPNGAGKSTFFNLIAGELYPSQGSVYFEDRNITNLPVHKRANLGLGHTFQRNNLFMGLTVFENVRLAVQHFFKVTHHWFNPVSRYHQVEEKTTAVLAQVGLTAQRHEVVNTLAYGQQRSLEIALALALEPKLLLLDEPTAGMSPAETREITHLIQGLPRSLTMMIVEHDMDVIFSLADHITVLHYGQVVASGPPNTVRHDPNVQQIYLGPA